MAVQSICAFARWGNTIRDTVRVVSVLVCVCWGRVSVYNQGKARTWVCVCSSCTWVRICMHICVTASVYMIRVRKRDCVHTYTLRVRECVCVRVCVHVCVLKCACSWGEYGECVVR